MKFLLDQRCALQGAKAAGINLKVIFFAEVNPAVLPAGEADHPVAAQSLAGLQNVQRREDDNEKSLEAGEERLILLLLVVQHDIINDQIVALGCHGGNGMAHTAQCLFADRPSLDHNQRFSIFGYFLESKTIRVVLQGLRQHGAELIHLDMQERLFSNFLERLRNGTLARTADAVEKDDLR